MTDPHDDERLRALLDDAVADVEPSPALHHIQTRTQTNVTPMTRGPAFKRAVTSNPRAIASLRASDCRSRSKRR